MRVSAIRHHALTAYAIAAFAYLLLPIAVVIVFSFNDPVGRFNYVWQGFTLDQWRNWDAVPGLRDSIVVSIEVAAISSVAATALGTLIALALVRHRFYGRGATNFLIFLPMSTPEIVLGASLLALFLNLRINLGMTTIIIAHVMFCISFVVVTVKARIASLDPRLEQAAMDLYADEWQTFRRITLPLVAPGILAASLLAFSLSFDDFIITNFNSGAVNTFPKFVYVSSLRGIPAQANVIASFMFLLALVAVVVAQAVAGRRRPS
jgi:spermidine/putrescine transport system permease protein